MTYDPNFYEAIREGCQRSAAEVVPIVYDLVRPERVVDFGCGEGWWLDEFKRRGCEVLGFDGDYVRPVLAEGEFKPWDMAANPEISAPGFDLAVSLEVAEHLPAEAAPLFVASLVEAAPVVLFSAAIPGQGGVGHVNEQWPDYWADLFREHRYTVSGALRWEIWENEGVENWYRSNLLLFASLKAPKRVVEFIMRNPPGPLRVVHPFLWSYHRQVWGEEIARLNKVRVEGDRAVAEEIAERDRLHERLDQLAYAVAPQSVIGEHTSMNDPWANALRVLLDRPDELEAIVRRLAEEEFPIDDARHCMFCGVDCDNDNDHHLSDCPSRRAWAWVKAHPTVERAG